MYGICTVYMAHIYSLSKPKEGKKHACINKHLLIKAAHAFVDTLFYKCIMFSLGYVKGEDFFQDIKQCSSSKNTLQQALSLR